MDINGQQHTVFSDISTFYEAFLSRCTLYIIVIIHIIFILNVLWLLWLPGIACSADVNRAKFQGALRYSLHRFHKTSAQRSFWSEIPRVLINLHSRILRRQASWICSWVTCTNWNDYSINSCILVIFSLFTCIFMKWQSCCIPWPDWMFLRRPAN